MLSSVSVPGNGFVTASKMANLHAQSSLIVQDRFSPLCFSHTCHTLSSGAKSTSPSTPQHPTEVLGVKVESQHHLQGHITHCAFKAPVPSKIQCICFLCTCGYLKYFGSFPSNTNRVLVFVLWIFPPQKHAAVISVYPLSQWPCTGRYAEHHHCH